MPDGKKDPDRYTLYCSFCGKSQHEVKKLIAGPTVFICDECIILCLDIVIEDGKISIPERVAKQAHALRREQAAAALVRRITSIIEREKSFHRPYAEELERVLGFYEEAVEFPNEPETVTTSKTPEPRVKPTPPDLDLSNQGNLP